MHRTEFCPGDPRASPDATLSQTWVATGEGLTEEAGSRNSSSERGELERWRALFVSLGIEG
jgi:hypothetical protein